VQILQSEHSSQDVSQVMSKIDENRNKRTEIASFLNNQQIANIND
jgi:hypothetical protein